MGWKYPRSSIQHRDAVLGVSFLLGTIEFWPKGRPMLQSIQKVLPVLVKIHDLLGVEKMPEGEVRDIGRAGDAAVDFGAYYDSEWDADSQYRGWLRMWFLSCAAFEDALHIAPSYVEPSRDLWIKAQGIIDRMNQTLARRYAREAQEGFAIWCAHASPYHHEELEEWITNG